MEAARLAALAACDVLYTGREPAFDNVVFTLAQMFRVPMAMLTLVSQDRVWAKAKVGALQAEWQRTETFCRVVVEAGEVLIVEDASLDPRFATMACVLDEPRIRFCASAPLHGPGGHAIGALCALDRHARTVPDRQRSQLVQIAHEASELLRIRVPGLDVS